MAKRLAELGALQDAVSNNEAAPSRLGLAGYIRGLFLDWSANPYNPLSRLSARGRLLGYFWDSGAIGLSMNFADQNYLVKDGTVQSKSFNQIVNFSRTTNATVTNSAGVITYAPHNLLTYSEQFDNAAWSKTTTTVTANTIASPTSTITGDTLTAGGANSTTLHSYTAIAQPYTFSIYIRRRTGTGTIEITADGSTYVAKTITSSWTRFDTTITPTAGTRTPGVRIVTSGDAVDVWGAQLEIGSTATTYNPTTVKNLLGYSELFDNAAWTKSNSFVQTNLLTYSEAFDNAAWVADAITVTANNTLSPNGYQTADLVVPTAVASTGHRVRETLAITPTIGVNYAYSIYAKASGYNFIKLRFGTLYANFNISTGEVGQTNSTASSIEPLDNGWFRCTFYGAYASNNTAYIYVIDQDNAGVDGVSFTGNGTSGIYLWGAQLVQGSVAGDYRRTDAAALPVYYPNHNGVVCAEKLVENTSTAFHNVFSTRTSVVGEVLTRSVYLKAGERTWAGIYIQDGGDFFTYINLSTGAVGNVGAGCTATVQNVGNGWYRVGITRTVTSATAGQAVISIFPTTGNAVFSYAGNGTSGIYIFGAQLSDSASLDLYVLNAAAAPTAAAYYGARFDYDPVTLAPKGLLIEEQRANLALQSEDFSSASWTKTASSVAANAILSPDGMVDADKLIESSATSTHEASQAIARTINVTQTASIYAKAAEKSKFRIFSNSTSNPNTLFDLISVTATPEAGSTATITHVGNGWYRCTATATPASTASPTFSIALVDNSGAASYTGDGVSGLYIWGAQLEAGAFATSYIPTAASQVTRAADVATIQGSNFYSWFNQNAGSLSAQFSTPASGNRNIIALDDNTANNNIRLRTEGTDPYLKQAWVGTEQVALDLGTVAANTVYKIAASYQINDYAGVIANGTVGTDTVANTPIITMARLGTDQAGAYLNSTIKTFTYYPQKLSTDILKGLTA